MIIAKCKKRFVCLFVFSSSKEIRFHEFASHDFVIQLTCTSILKIITSLPILNFLSFLFHSSSFFLAVVYISSLVFFPLHRFHLFVLRFEERARYPYFPLRPSPSILNGRTRKAICYGRNIKQLISNDPIRVVL